MKQHRARLAEDHEHLRYVMRKGDTISEILLKLHSRPLWGTNGNILKTSALNQDVVLENGHLISYNVMVLFPFTKLKPSPEYNVDPKTLIITFNDIIPEPPPDDKITPIVENARTPDSVPPAIEQPPKPVLEKSVSDIDFSEEKNLKNSLRVGYDPNFTRLDGADPVNGGKASLASGLNHDIGVGYRRFIDKKTSVGTGFDLNLSGYQDATGRKIQNSSGLYYNFRVDAGYEVKPGFSIMPRISYAQRPFLKALSTSTLQLDRIGTLGLGAGMQWFAFQRKKNRMTVEGGGGYLFPGSGTGYTIKSGYFYALTTRFIRDIDSVRSWDVCIYYRADQQNTSILIDGTSELGLKFSYGFKF